MSIELMVNTLVQLLSSPYTMWMLLLGTGIGIFFGAVPGLGGRLAIAVTIPFIFGKEMIPGAVFLLSMHAVTGTSGQISSILFGVPGTGDDAATIVDGYPMAKKGQAGLALGASLMASGIGGVIGAGVLAILIPVIEPIVLKFSPAEFFFLALLGITFVAFVSGSAIFKGIVVGLYGMMLAFVGMDPQTGIARYSEDLLFLWDGLDLITAVLALFAVPEMIHLGVKGGAISSVSREFADTGVRAQLKGCLLVFKHWWLVLRTSMIGAFIGILPGLGGSAAAWICYGHAVQSAKDPEMFGKGDVRGVIAPETATNSKEGGSLLPTLFFGVPGSSGMAILLGAFLILGIQPGPMMLVQQLDLVWILIWALVVSNLLAVVILLFITRWVALLTFVRGGILIPVVLIITVLGTLLAKGQWENVIMLGILSMIGYGLLKYDWPRPPFAIGIILGAIAEQSLNKAWQLWRWDFFVRPLSVILAAMILITIAFAIYRGHKDKLKKLAETGGRIETRDNGVTTWQALTHGKTLFTILLFSIFASMVYFAADYPWPANFLPNVMGIPGMALTLLLITIDVREFKEAGGKLDPRTEFEKYMADISKHTEGLDADITHEKLEVLVEDHSDMAKSRFQREVLLFGHFFFLLALTLLFGYWIAIPIFMFTFLRF
ncbi:MAG: tripartite tricarboxylate transporter permease, partial [Alphaproteobacteria bacterium]